MKKENRTNRHGSLTAAGEIKIQDVQNGLVDSMRRVDVQVEPLEHVVEGEK